MVHASVENKYVGPTNKTNTGVQIPNQIFANLSFSLYFDLSQTTAGGREQTRRRNRALKQFTPAIGSGAGRLKRPMGLSGCFRPSRWILEWAQEQKVSSHVCSSVTGVHAWMRPFSLSLFMDTKWGLMGPSGNWKEIGYWLLGHICFVGPGLGQSRAFSKKHVVTNVAAVAHGRNGHKNSTGKDLVQVSD